MRSILILTLLFLGVSAIAQKTDTLNRANAEGNRTGYWIVRHSNGNIRYEGYFVKGNPLGDIRRYDADGNLQSVSHYSGKTDTVDVEMFYANGYKAAKGFYLNQKKEGKWQLFSYFTRDYKVLEEHYKKDLRHGKSRKFHPNGKIAEILYWNEGQKHGVWEQYTLTGTLILKANYQEDMLHGNFNINHDNGQPHVKGEYLKDLKHGTWVFQDENGKITLELHFTNGIADNQAELDSLHQQLLNELDSQKGKIKDPTLDEIKW